jgi:hypothetical protein
VAAVRNTRWSLVSETGGAEPKWELFDLSEDYGQKNNVASGHPEIVQQLSSVFERWWGECLPMMVNENAQGPQINPFQARYYAQFGGSPTAEDLAKMDPTRSIGAGKKPQRAKAPN